MSTSPASSPAIEHCDGDVRAYPLAFQQERVLYLNKLSPQGALWNRVSCKHLTGEIDVTALTLAIDDLVERHSVLRTRIALADGEPFQSKHDRIADPFEYIDATAYGSDAQAKEILNRLYETPFSLEDGVLFKAFLVRRGERKFWLILKLHHIISDATTLQILWDDINALYNFRLGQGEPLAAPEIEYFDYAVWLRRRFRDDGLKAQEDYWLQTFSGALPELDLPADTGAPASLTFTAAAASAKLPLPLVSRLKSFSLSERVIAFSTMLSAYYLLLHHYCRQDDIVIGTVFSGRHHSPQIRRLAGFFTNTVALRLHLDAEQSVRQFVAATHALVSRAYKMQDYPFEWLVEKLGPDRAQRRNPLFRAMFNVLNVPAARTAMHGVQHEEWLEPEISASQVDLFLEIRLGQEPEVRIEYNAEIFTRPLILRMLRHYIALLGGIVESAEANACDLSMLDASETALIQSFGDGGSGAPARARTVVDLLEERALRSPDLPALLHAGGAITCREVNRLANRLAATLASSGVQRGDIVAVMIDRSPQMVIALLATLKAGAAYLPIDPQCPPQRIAYILNDSHARCLLTGRATIQATPAHLGSVHCIAVDDDASYRGDGENSGGVPTGADAAYVIYTSGSTGTPKGVVVEHGALMNTLDCLNARYPVDGKTILLKTNYTFDVSAAELFGWLFESGRLAVLDKDAEKEPARIREAIERYGVTHINFVPSMLDALLSGAQECDLRTLERLQYVFVAGEALKPELVSLFHKRVRNVRLENLYGPTEAAIYATGYSVPRDGVLSHVPIGKPLPNTRAYILDDKLRVVPIGVSGELCLSGAGLARGYLNQPVLTGDRFRPNPHWPGQTLYKTGDLTRWNEDGLIQFLGRFDGQVKIRGFRVEIGEVERKLRSCRGVAEAAVAAKADPFGQPELVAYAVMQAGQELRCDDLRKELTAWLPGYMIPSWFVPLERLPRLASGKIDGKALPEPRRQSEPAAAAATELEKTIIAIAERLLNARGLDPSSSFFRLGGNSLLTLRFIAALDDALGMRLSVMDFLELPTIRDIAKHIEELRSNPTATVPTTSCRTRECRIGVN